MQSVEREYRKDYRNEAMLEISKMPGSGSDTILSKAQTYFSLWQDALSTGDEDQAIQFETAYNNAKESYSNKLESEAKKGLAASKRALAKINGIEEEVIKKRELLLKDNIDADVKYDPASGSVVVNNQRTINDAGTKLMVQLDILGQRSDLAAQKLQQTLDIDPDDVEKIESLKNEVYSNTIKEKDIKEHVSWTKDADGNEVPEMVTDSSGISRVKLVNAVGRLSKNGDINLYDESKNQYLSYKFDDNGKLVLGETFNDSNQKYIYDPDTGLQLPIQDQVGLEGVDPGNRSDKEIVNDLKSGEKDTGTFTYKMPDGRVVTGMLNRDLKDGGQKLTKEKNPLAYKKGYTNNPTLSSMDQELLFNSAIRNAQMQFAKRAGYNMSFEELVKKNLLPKYDNTSGQWVLPVTNIKGREVINTPGPINLPATASYTPSGSIAKGYGINAAPMTTEPTKTFHETFFEPTIKRDTLGYAGGVEYWKQQRPDGGYDVYKGNNFKLSKADAEKELGKSLGNW